MAPPASVSFNAGVLPQKSVDVLVSPGIYELGTLKLEGDISITLSTADVTEIVFVSEAASGDDAFFIAGQVPKAECDYACAQNWLIANPSDLDKLTDFSTSFPTADMPPSWENDAIFPAGYHVHIDSYGGAQAKSLSFEERSLEITTTSNLPAYSFYPTIDVQLGADAAHNCEPWILDGIRYDPKPADKHKCVSATSCYKPPSEDASAEELKAMYDDLATSAHELRVAAHNAAVYSYEQTAIMDLSPRKVIADIREGPLVLRACSTADGFDENFSSAFQAHLPLESNVTSTSTTVSEEGFKFEATGLFPRDVVCTTPTSLATCGDIGPVIGAAGSSDDIFKTEIVLEPDNSMSNRVVFYAGVEAMADMHEGFCGATTSSTLNIEKFRRSLGSSEYKIVQMHAGENIPQIDTYMLANGDNAEEFAGYLCNGIMKMKLEEAVIGRVDCQLLLSDLTIISSDHVYEQRRKQTHLQRRGEYGRSTELIQVTVRYSLYGRGTEGALLPHEVAELQDWINMLSARYEPSYASRPCYSAKMGIDYDCLNTEIYAAADKVMAGCEEIDFACESKAKDAAKDICQTIAGCGPLGWKSPYIPSLYGLSDGGECYDKSVREVQNTICEADVANQVAAAASANDKDELPLIPIVAGIGGLVVIIAVYVIFLGKRNDIENTNPTREVISFENPAYDNPNDAGVLQGSTGDEGLYDEPAFNSPGPGISNKDNPMYSDDGVPEDGDSGGYLDVQPSDSDGNDDDEDVEQINEEANKSDDEDETDVDEDDEDGSDEDDEDDDDDDDEDDDEDEDDDNSDESEDE